MMLIARIHVLSVALFLFLSFLLSVNSSFAETKTFIKEYTYHAGDEDSRNSSRIISLREVKRLLLEELGTYLESQTEVKNFQITKDQITTLTAGIVGTEIIEDKWDGKVYWLKAKITANPQDVIKSIDSLRKDREKVKELEELRKKSEELLKENERLNKELKTGKGIAKQKTAQAYKRNIDNLSSTEWWERGVRLQQSGKRTEAIKAYRKAIELNPQDPRAYNLLGTLYGWPGTYQKAIKIYSEGIKMNPQSKLLYSNRGYYYSALGNYQQAIKDYNKAIELEPQEAMTYYSRGGVYSNLDNYQQAINDYNKAIELEPKSIWFSSMFYSSRGSAYSSLKNYQQAIEDYSKAIELNPDDLLANKYNICYDIYNDRGFAYYRFGNYQQAINDFSKAIELNPQFAIAYHNRGVAYSKLSNTQQAIENYKIAARLGLKEAQDLLRSKGIEW